jgi:hypothetical protein
VVFQFGAHISSAILIFVTDSEKEKQLFVRPKKQGLFYECFCFGKKSVTTRMRFAER